MYEKSGDIQSALREFTASRDLSRELVALDPDNPEYRFHLSSCHHALPSCYGTLAGVSSLPKGMSSADELQKAAESEFHNAGSIRFELCAAYPLVVKYQSTHGATVCNFGCFLADHDRFTRKPNALRAGKDSFTCFAPRNRCGARFVPQSSVR